MPVWSKTERNHVFEGIQQSGLDPAECDINSDKGWVFIVHEQSGSVFRIGDGITKKYQIRANVGDGKVYRNNFTKFDPLVEEIKGWAAGVREWVDAPDL
jgi:hypothetical protein